MRLSHGLLALLAACAPSTQLVDTWKDPAASSIHFSKVLAACVCRDPKIRRIVEEQVAKRIQNATPAYTLIADSELQDRKAAEAKVHAAGFDGAIVMQLVSVDRTETYVPGQPYAVPVAYGQMWGGWAYGWSTLYDPGYVREDQSVNFNTNVYRVADSKLIWASRSETMNPSSVPELVDEVIDANIREMKHEKVFTTQNEPQQ
jgi:hypothetical protein